MDLDELTALWDAHIRDWMKGEASSDERLRRWQETYRGEGDGAIDRDATPEPWIGNPGAAPGVVLMGLTYPWHSRSWQTHRFQIDEGIVREFILDPIASVPRIKWALGKGKSWWATLESLATLPGWTHVGYLGGPDAGPCPSGLAHRRWLIVRAPTGLKIAAMRLRSMPIWPKAGVVPRIRMALTAIANQ